MNAALPLLGLLLVLTAPDAGGQMVTRDPNVIVVGGLGISGKATFDRTCGPITACPGRRARMLRRARSYGRDQQANVFN